MNDLKIFKEIKYRNYYTFDEIDDFFDSLNDNAKIVTNNKKISYYNIPCSFDIETSSFYDNGIKTSIMYEWTLCIDWVVIIGRTWDEFLEISDRLEKFYNLCDEIRLIIYVHNLSFEFQAFRKIFSWSKIFALKERKPISALTTNGIEFRCSYLLSGYSLAKIGEHLQKYKIKKLVGDLDYTLIRHSETPLTETEIGYCVNDVLVVVAYIQELLNRLGNITKIPLTKTGFVRRYCRNQCLYGDKSHRQNIDKYKMYRRIMTALSITTEEYKMAKEAFQGGFTHANPYYSRGIFNNVGSFDLTSSYPTVMIAEKFPMARGEKYEVKNLDDFNISIENYCCLFDIRLYNVTPKIDYDNYISYSHCRTIKNYILNNGRVVSADFIEMTITEIDFFIINAFYKFDNFEIGVMYRYEKDYLPTDFVKSIIDLYKDKTELKGVENKEQEYMISKENINSCYGMCVTDICRDEIVCDGNNWSKEAANIDVKVEQYNKSKNRFLSYLWGIWVTAYARYNLFTGIISFGEDYIYSDTDSIKATNYEKHMDYIKDYNENIVYKLDCAMKYHKLPLESTRPKNIYGQEKQLGVWDFEGVYTRFKTLGAKRYLYEFKNKNNELDYVITISGVKKDTGVKYLKETYKDPFEAFDDNLVFPAESTGKLTHTYIDEEQEGYVTDYLGNTIEYKEASGTHLEPAEYRLSIAEEYVNYLLGIQEI